MKAFKSQNDEIYDSLLRGEALTPLDALDRFGCFRLAARIKDLREEGFEIQTELLTLHNGKRIASYRMNPAS